MSLTNHSGGRTGRPSRPVQACSVMPSASRVLRSASMTLYTKTKEVQVFRVIEIPHRIGFSIGDAVGEPNIGSGKIVHEQHPLLKVPQKRGAGTAALAAAVLALGLLAGCAAPLPAPSAPVRDVAGDLVPENDEQAAVLAGKLDRAGQRLHSWKELAPALRASSSARSR